VEQRGHTDFLLTIRGTGSYTTWVQSETRTVAAQGDGEKVTYEGIAADGSPISYRFTTNLDGKDSPFSGAQIFRGDSVAVRAESQASDMTIMAIAGHVSKRMLEHYSRIRTDAKRAALDAIAQGPKQVIFQAGVHQNVHQLEEAISGASVKPLN
jgi:hypothetical protein